MAHRMSREQIEAARQVQQKYPRLRIRRAAENGQTQILVSKWDAAGTQGDPVVVNDGLTANALVKQLSKVCEALS